MVEACRVRLGQQKECNLSGFIIFLLVVWLVLAILGAVLEGLFWLTVVGILLLVGTAVYGWIKRNVSDAASG